MNLANTPVHRVDHMGLVVSKRDRMLRYEAALIINDHGWERNMKHPTDNGALNLVDAVRLATINWTLGFELPGLERDLWLGMAAQQFDQVDLSALSAYLSIIRSVTDLGVKGDCGWPVGWPDYRCRLDAGWVESVSPVKWLLHWNSAHASCAEQVVGVLRACK